MTVVLLVEDNELAECGVESFAEVMALQGIETLRFPIADMHVPIDRAAFGDLLAQIEERLAAGETVGVACRGGLGRTGTLAASVLVDSGLEPETAITATRASRQGAIETHEQGDFVRSWHSTKGFERSIRADPPIDSRVAQATTFAWERHTGQLRKGTPDPYIVHPRRVARILASHYPGQTDLEVAGWLHDTLEDTATEPPELQARFGPQVCRLVEAVTKEVGASWHAPTDPDVMRLKAADALDNVSESVAGLRRGEPVFDRFKDGKAKVRYWRTIADAALRLLPGEPLSTELDEAVGEAETFAALVADVGR